MKKINLIEWLWTDSHGKQRVRGMRRYAAMLLLLIITCAHAYAANGDVLFTQAFGSGSLTYTQNVAYTKTTTLTNLVGNGSNLFTSLTTSNKNSTGIAINHATGGNSTNATGFFQAYFNNTSGYWSCIRTNDFAATAPTALKMTIDVWVNIISGTSNAAGVYFAIGNGFTDGLKSSSAEGTSTVHSGFGITAESSPTICQYNTPGTDIYATTLSKSTWLSITWIMNNTGSSLTYSNPTGSGTTTLANDKFDIWLKTQAGAASTYTKVVSAQSATTASVALQELYIGSTGGKKMEFRMDNIVVTDLTPSSGFTVSASVNPAGYGSLSTTSISNVASGTAVSTSSNVLTVGASSITATAASATSAWTYSFTNWTKSDGTALPSTVTAALAVRANFSRTGKSYTITLDKDGGSGGSATVSATYGSAMPSAGAAPTKSGFTFLGYYTSKVGAGTQYYNATPASVKNSDFTSTATLYAGWKVNAPSISFSEDLSNMVTITGTAGASIYYTTDGSTPSESSTLYSAPFTINADKTIKAIAIKAGAQNSAVASLSCTYSAPPTWYTLSYDANGGTGSMPSQEFVSGTTVYAGQNAGFTAPTGKIFSGWNTKSDGEGTSYAEGASFTLSGNTTLYAQWITASTSSTYCISMYNLNVSDQMKYFTYSGSNDMQILDLEVPDYKTNTNNFWVGEGGSWKSGELGNSGASSANERLEDMCLKGNRGTKLGTGSQGVLARFFVYDNSTYNNLYIEFTPKQYSLIWGPDGSSWSPVKLYPSGYENEWTSEVVTLTSDQISSYNYYVGILKADDGVAYWYKSNTLSVGSMGTYNKRTDTWGGNVSTLSAGDKGFFRMWSDATGYDNWRCHFVPVYTLSYNANSGSGAPSAVYIASEGDDAHRTVYVSATEPTRTGYTFTGWATTSGRAAAGTVDYVAGTAITIDEDTELFAVWTCITPDAPTAAKITVTPSCAGTGATFSANTAGIPSYVTWYWQTAADGTSTSYPASSDYTTSTTAGTYTMYLRAKNTQCGEWSNSASTPSKSVKVKTPVTASWSTSPANGTAGGNMNATLTTNYASGVVYSSSNTDVATVSGNGTTTCTITYASAGSARITATVTGAGDSYCSTASVYTDITVADPKYTVTYTANGGSGSVPTDATSYDSGDEVTVKGKNTLSKTGYTFTGWSDGTTFFEEGNKFNITGNKSLAAVWEPTNSCTTTLADINFKSSSWSGKTFSQGNTTTSDQINGLYFYSKNSDAAKQFSLSSNTSNGLTFPNNNFASGNYYLCIPLQSGDINGKITVTIKHGYSSATASYKYYFWDGATSYTDGNTNGSGGTQVTDASSSDTEITFEVTASNANHKGYLYIGRQSSSYTQIYGVTVTTPCPTSTSKTVTFNKGSNPAPASPSNIPAQKTVPYNHKILRPATDPSASNYIFNGWVTTSGGSTSFDFANTSITSNTTIYAKWAAKTAPTQYTFSLSDPCASASPSATLSGSQSGWSYQLYKNGAVSGDPKAGTGKALTWTGLTAGSYYVKTVETSTQASAQIGESAIVYAGTSISTNLATSRTVNANVSTTVSFVASGASLSYQWYTCNSDGTGKVAIDGKEAPTFTYTFTNSDAPTKYICCVATGTCGTVTSNIQTVTINRTYYLTVDLDGGSWSGGISSGYRTVSTFNIPTPIPTKSGYVFLGWSFLGSTYQPGAAITPNQTATLRALWASPCFSVSDASKKTMPDGQPAGTVITGGGMINGTITGGTLTYTGTDASGLNGNAKGLIFNNDNDELTVNITDGMLQEGTVIVIGSYGTASSSSHTNGLKVSGNNMSPATVVSSTSNNSISQRYVVADGDGIEGTSSFTIRRVASTDQMMLNTISVAGCQSCTAITPTLSYSSTTLYAFGGMPRGAVPTLTGNTGNGAVSYSSSNTNVVTVDSETGVVTAVGCGSATVSAIIEPNGGYCGAVRSVNFTVPALVTQTIRVGTSTSWNGDGSAAPDMSFNDPTSTTSQVAVIANSGYTFDATTASDKANMTRKFTGTETTKGAKYVTLKFKNATHNLRLGEVIARIQPVTSNGKAQVEIYEGSTLRLTSSEVTGITQGQLNDVRFTFASPYVFAANTNIEVRLYFYGQTDGFRLGTPFYVNGGVLVDQRFTDANSTGLWSDPANWDGGALPEIYHDVVIEKPATVDIAHATAKSVVIYNNGDSKTGKLTINPNKGLEVAETVQKTTDGSSYSGTGEADLVLESNEYGNASLIFDNSNGCEATVMMYSKASVEGNTWNWQYVGTPFTGSIPLYNYYGGYMYKWNGTGWDVVHGTDELTPFAGYCLTQASPTTHYMSGELIATDGNNYSVTISSASTDMVIANSWTAPISICSFTESTFTSSPKTIYLFNTGSATEGSEEGEAAGTYITVPINSAKYTENYMIAPMQGFFVTTNDGTAGKITMKYDELVRTTANHTDIVAGPMKSPTRERVDYGEPDVMKIRVNGSTYMDRVIILAREDFSEGFDDGWDGEKMGYNSAAPAVFVINEEGKNDAVSAIPEYEGTLVGFRAGSEDNVYTMTFEYNGEEVLYLNDLKAQMSAEIATGQTYMFTTEDGDSEVRFIISHNPIRRITTGVDDVETGTKARKVLINEKIYIIRKGRVYSVDGQIVK